MSVITDSINLAKTFVAHEVDLNAKIEVSAVPAVQELKVLISKKEYCRFYNKGSVANITKVESHGAGKSRIFVDKLNVKIFDDVFISGTTIYDGCYEIEEVNETDSFLVIDTDFTITKTGTVKNEVFETYKSALAWLICYYTTNTVQEIKKDVVLETSKQLGEGDVKTFAIKDINLQRENYLRNAYILLGMVEIRKS